MDQNLASLVADVAILFAKKGKSFSPDAVFAKLFEHEMKGEDVESFIRDLSGGEVFTQYKDFTANKEDAKAVSAMLIAHENFLVRPSAETLKILRHAKVQKRAADLLAEDKNYLEREKIAFLLRSREIKDIPSWKGIDSATGYLIMRINLHITEEILKEIA